MTLKHGIARWALSFCIAAVSLSPLASAGGIGTFYISFDDFSFTGGEFVTRTSGKTPEERGLKLTDGRFGKGLLLTRPTVISYSKRGYSAKDLDLITSALLFPYNEPLFMGAGIMHPAYGAVAFWVKGPLSAGTLFEQTACRWGRREKFLIGIASDGEGTLSAYIEDARYVKHTISASVSWDTDAWNFLVLNWDGSMGLELYVNGFSAASSWGRDTWWDTALPGLFRLPMTGAAYDEFRYFSRPLKIREIESLMKSNTPPDGRVEIAGHTPEQRDRLARALGVSTDMNLHAAEPSENGEVLTFTEIAPRFIGEGHIPAHLCHDGRYVMAWPHPADLFTLIPGDGSHTAERLEIEPPPGVPFNYMTIEGNLTGLPVYTNCAKTGDSYAGDTLFDIPEDGRFFHGSVIDRIPRGTITLPFLKEYGAPEGFKGDVRFPRTGETRVHEIGLFDVTTRNVAPAPGELVFHLDKGGLPVDRYGFALKSLCPANERTVLTGHRSGAGRPEEQLDTGMLSRLHLITEPLTGIRSFGSVLIDMNIRTEEKEDVLLVRLRDPGVPSTIWTHAEVRLTGFESGGRLRLLLDCTPFLTAPGDRVWIEFAAYGRAHIALGGTDGARIVLKPSPLMESASLYEVKALLPSVAEYARSYSYLPWWGMEHMPDYTDPPAFGGQYDVVFPAQAVTRVLPHSRLAAFFLEYGKPDYYWGWITEPEQYYGVKTFDIPEGVPRWAWYQHRIQSFRYRILEWMAANQNRDGQFGGGWNDDILIMWGRVDMLLDGSRLAHSIFDGLYDGLERTRLFCDGYCHIEPIDYLHCGDFVRERYRQAFARPGDPKLFRRALTTARYADKPEETPMNWKEGTPFLFDRSLLEWYWGRSLPDSAYLNGDETSVTDFLARFASKLDDREFFRQTLARCHTDTWYIWEERRFVEMIVGGWGTHVRDRADSTASAAWPGGGGEDLARWVTYADSVTFTCRMYSFDPLPRKVTARLFRIEPGIYEIFLREDNGGQPGELLSSKKKAMRRFDTINVTVPPGRPVVLSVRRVETINEPAALPDLAVASYDCERTGAMLSIRVSNLGAAPSKPSVLRVFDNHGRKIVEKPVPSIDAPLDFVEKSVLVEFAGVPGDGILRVAVDPDDVQVEIYEANNDTLIEPSVTAAR